MTFRNFTAHNEPEFASSFLQGGKFESDGEKLRKLEKERDDLQRKFTKGVKEIKRRAEFKNLVLEKQLQEIQARFDERQQQLREVLQAAKLEPQIVQSVTTKL